MRWTSTLGLLLAVTVSPLAASAQGTASTPNFTFAVYNQPLAAGFSGLIKEASQAHLSLIVDQASLPPAPVTLVVSKNSIQDIIEYLRKSFNLGVVTYPDGTIMIGSNATLNASGLQGHDQIVLQYADANSLASELKPSLPSGTIVVPDPRSNSLLIIGDAGARAAARGLVALFDVPTALVSKQVPMNNVTPKEAADAVQAMSQLGYPVRVATSEASNAVVLTGSAGGVEAASALLSKLDSGARQVRIQVRVVDLEPVNDSKNVGPTLNGVDSTGAVQNNATFLSFVTKSIPVNATLSFLLSTGAAKVLAEPNLLTVNNKESKIVVGAQDTVVFNTSGGLLGSQTAQTINSGVIMDVTPLIGADGGVLLKMHIEFSQITGTNTFGYPILATRSEDTWAHLDNSTTLVLGGLYQSTASRTQTKVPLLGDIPIFGRLFRNVQGSNLVDEVRFYVSVDTSPTATAGQLTPQTLTPGQAADADAGGAYVERPRQPGDPVWIGSPR